MASFITKKVANKVFKEQAENKFGTDDPYFEHVAAVDLNGHPTGKYTKRKRACPPGLTNQEEKVLKKMTRRAYRLDNAFNLCGIRVGWSAVIGLVPALGDAIDALMALMVVRTAMQARIPAALKSRMMLNIVLDFFVGLVPFLGDIADVFYRCNTRNAALLWEHLRDRGAERIEKGEHVPSDVDDHRHKSPGRGVQNENIKSSKKSTHRSQRQDSQRGRQEAIEMKEQSSRQHSSRRGAASQQETRFVNSQDIVKQPEKSKSRDLRGRGLQSRPGATEDVGNIDIEHDAGLQPQHGKRRA